MFLWLQTDRPVEGVQARHCTTSIGWLLEFYALATSKVILGQVMTCASVHSWRLYSAAPLGDQATSTMTWYPTQPQYPDTEPVSG